MFNLHLLLIHLLEPGFGISVFLISMNCIYVAKSQVLTQVGAIYSNWESSGLFVYIYEVVQPRRVVQLE